MKRSPLLGLAAAALPASAPAFGQAVLDAEPPAVTVARQTPAWALDRVLYEVNIRQYTPEGTFDAFRAHLPRLQEMGVGILWLMPIHPIGQEKRKGTLGSYYAATDYTAVNPEFGTLDDLRELVDEAHARGMFVILDWVANHTAWDHHWTRKNPEWFTKGEDGGFTPPVKEWDDVIDLDYGQLAMRRAMVDAMRFWVEEVGVDGFRCDVAGMVPNDFWAGVRTQLSDIKPVFMLAEAEGQALYDACFDMTYAWGFNALAMQVTKGEKTAADLWAWLKEDARRHAPDELRMYFTTNHDENSWNGTVFERYGEAAEVFAVLTMTLDGMPLIYSGQEAGNPDRLEFFEKDEIAWRPHRMAEVYGTLARLKRDSPALWHGEPGGRVQRLTTNQPTKGFAFGRGAADHRVVVVANLGAEPTTVRVKTAGFAGHYRDAMNGEDVTLGATHAVELPAWGWRVLAR